MSKHRKEMIQRAVNHLAPWSELQRFQYTKSFTKTSSDQTLCHLACKGSLPTFTLRYVPCFPATDPSLVPLLSLLTPLFLTFLSPAVPLQTQKCLLFFYTAFAHSPWWFSFLPTSTCHINYPTYFTINTVSPPKRNDADSARTKSPRLLGCVPNSAFSNITLAALANWDSLFRLVCQFFTIKWCYTGAICCYQMVSTKVRVLPNI